MRRRLIVSNMLIRRLLVKVFLSYLKRTIKKRQKKVSGIRNTNIIAKTTAFLPRLGAGNTHRNGCSTKPLGKPQPHTKPLACAW